MEVDGASASTWGVDAYGHTIVDVTKAAQTGARTSGTAPPWRYDGPVSVLRLPVDVHDPGVRRHVERVFAAAFSLRRAVQRDARARLAAYRAAHRVRAAVGAPAGRGGGGGGVGVGPRRRVRGRAGGHGTRGPDPAGPAAARPRPPAAAAALSHRPHPLAQDRPGEGPGPGRTRRLAVRGPPDDPRPRLHHTPDRSPPTGRRRPAAAGRGGPHTGPPGPGPRPPPPPAPTGAVAGP